MKYKELIDVGLTSTTKLEITLAYHPLDFWAATAGNENKRVEGITANDLREALKDIVVEFQFPKKERNLWKEKREMELMRMDMERRAKEHDATAEFLEAYRETAPPQNPIKKSSIKDIFKK